jgi:hypothetical protein
MSSPADPEYFFVQYTEGHLEKFVLSGCEVRCLGEKRLLRVLPGALSRSRGWVALAKGVTSAAMGARVVEVRPLPHYTDVAIRSRKANRLMLYTRFIRPIFALALTRPIVRTILPPILVY